MSDNLSSHSIILGLFVRLLSVLNLVPELPYFLRPKPWRAASNADHSNDAKGAPLLSWGSDQAPSILADTVTKKTPTCPISRNYPFRASFSIFSSVS